MTDRHRIVVGGVDIMERQDATIDALIKQNDLMRRSFVIHALVEVALLALIVSVGVRAEGALNAINALGTAVHGCCR